MQNNRNCSYLLIKKSLSFSFFVKSMPILNNNKLIFNIFMSQIFWLLSTFFSLSFLIKYLLFIISQLLSLFFSLFLVLFFSFLLIFSFSFVLLLLNIFSSSISSIAFSLFIFNLLFDFGVGVSSFLEILILTLNLSLIF